MANTVLITKIVTLSLMLISSLFSTVLPSILSRISRGSVATQNNAAAKILRAVQWVFHVSQGFAAGVLLSTGIVHLLEEAAEDLHDALHEIDGLPHAWKHFPFGHAACVLAFGAFYSFEDVIASLLSTILIKKGHSHDDHHHHHHHNDKDEVHPLLHGNHTNYSKGEKSVNATESDSEDSLRWAQMKPQDDCGHAHAHAVDVDLLTTQTFIRSAVSCFVLWISLFIHSILEGISIGLQKAMFDLVGILIGVLFHKMFEAYSLGVVVSNAIDASNSAVSYIVGIIFILTFSFATPVGIAVGTAITGATFSEALWFRITTSVLLCLASGAFLYISICELLTENSHKHGAFGNKFVTSLIFHFLFFLGMICMIVIAYWG